MTPCKPVLFVNSKARRGKEWFDQAEAELKRLGLELAQATRFEDIQALDRDVRRAIEDGCNLIILGGGDGTFSAVVRHLVRKDVTLGVLPLGTGNAFARDLEIPANLIEACKIVVVGLDNPSRIRAVDVGTVNDDIFLNVATIGLTTKIAKALTRDQKKKWGRLVYFASILRALPEMHAFDLTMTTENGTLKTRSLQVVVGNGRYHAGPFLLSPIAGIEDGFLDLYVVKTESKAALLKLAVHLPMGTQGTLEEVHAERCKKVQLTTTPSLPVTIDGESMTYTPMRLGISPGALKVIAN